MVPTTWITVVILELIHAEGPDFSEGMYLLDPKPMPRLRPREAGDSW